jgi:ketosteroid isomerase-like protein
MVILLAATFAFTACQQPPAPNANNTNRSSNATNAGNTNATASTAAGEAGVRAALTRLETAIASNDVAALDALYTDDYSFVTPTGEILTKEQRLAGFRDGSTKLESFRFDYERIRMYGQSAIVNADAIVKGTERGRDNSGMYAATIMFVETPSGWRVTSGQSSAAMGLPTPSRGAGPEELPTPKLESNANASPTPGTMNSNANVNR